MTLSRCNDCNVLPIHRVHLNPHPAQDFHEYQCPDCGKTGGVHSMPENALKYWEHKVSSETLRDKDFR